MAWEWFKEGDTVIPGRDTLGCFPTLYTKDKVYVVTKRANYRPEVIDDHGHPSLYAFNDIKDSKGGVEVEWFVLVTGVQVAKMKRKGMRQ